MELEALADLRIAYLDLALCLRERVYTEQLEPRAKPLYEAMAGDTQAADA
jgi:hypothetical protein